MLKKPEELQQEPKNEVAPFVADILTNRSFQWPAKWSEDNLDSFIRQTRRDGIQLLIHHFVSLQPEWQTWPEKIKQTFSETAKHDAILDLMRQQNLELVLNLLAASHIHPILLKGAALGLTHYPEPYLRTRHDTDLLIQASEKNGVQKIFQEAGFQPVTAIEGDAVNYQLSYRGCDNNGTPHTYDVHWRVFNPEVFSDILPYEDIQAESVSVSIGLQTASVLSPRHAFMHAVLHRAAHHWNEQKLIWIYDLHLLLLKTTQEEQKEWAAFVQKKGLTRLFTESVQTLLENFPSAPAEIFLSLLGPSSYEHPAVNFLNAKARLINLFAMNLRAQKGWGRKLSLLRENLFPSPQYILGKYQTQNFWALPWLYLRRLVEGFPKIFHTLKH